MTRDLCPTILRYRRGRLLSRLIEPEQPSGICETQECADIVKDGRDDWRLAAQHAGRRKSRQADGEGKADRDIDIDRALAARSARPPLS